MNNQGRIMARSNLHQQKGMALLIAMLILPLILVLGILMVNNSFFGLKIVDSRVMKNESNMTLNGAADELISQTSTGDFATPEGKSFDVSEFDGVSIEVETLNVNTSTNTNETDCGRTVQASGNNIKCRYLQLDLTHAFGREKVDGGKWAENKLSVGIEQPVFSE